MSKNSPVFLRLEKLDDSFGAIMGEIEDLLRSFCEKHLNDELMGYVLKLCDALGRKKN